MLGSAFLVLMAALHQASEPSRKVFSRAALAFATIYATLISLVYFVELTLVAPRIAAGDTRDIELLLFVPYRSFLFVVDLLGYSMMSISTLFGALALPPTRVSCAARLFMLLNGALLPCLVLQMLFSQLIRLAAFWAVTFLASAVCLARLFSQLPAEAHK
jgi:hypothetical protein